MSIGHGHPINARERDEWAADERFSEAVEEFYRLHPETLTMGYLQRAPIFYNWLANRKDSGVEA